jgi:hypothetical protein
MDAIVIHFMVIDIIVIFMARTSLSGVNSDGISTEGPDSDAAPRKIYSLLDFLVLQIGGKKEYTEG